MVTVDQLLRATVGMDGSDLHLKAGSPALVRKYGELIALDMPPLTSDEIRALAYSIITPAQIKRFEDEWELDAAYHIEALARFRVNCFIQRGDMGMVFRVIPLRIQTMEELSLPPVCRYFAERPRGLVLVTGP